jgi:hypothetical protein
MKTPKIKASRTYINSQGQMVTQLSDFERLVLRIRRAIKVIPFSLGFILISLVAVQIFCVFGLFRSLLSQEKVSDDLGVYLFLIFAIFIICSMSLAISWFVTEEKSENSQMPWRSNIYTTLKSKIPNSKPFNS